MKPRIPENTLNEDLKALGLGDLTEDRMAKLALGTPLSMTEQGAPPEDEPDPDEEEEEDDDEEYDESVHDPIDGPFVTPALFDRIEALPFDALSEEQVGQLIENLKAKRIPSNIPGVRERATAVAERLMGEAMGKRTRRYKAGSMSMQASYVCKKGYRKKDPKDPKSPCIRSAQAVGGSGKLARITRTSGRWAMGKGRKSVAKSERLAGRRHPKGQTSEFAVELENLLSESVEKPQDVRNEILEHVDNVIDLLAQEFDDVAVTEVFNEAVAPLASSYEAGRLDEAVMAPDAFLAELRPVVALITRSLDRLDGVPGNR
ncbi:MAG: hypothetical protein WC683_02070 [bacterium]